MLYYPYQRIFFHRESPLVLSLRIGGSFMNTIFRLDMNGIPYSYPSIMLKNAEISKVCKEISSNYGRYQNKRIIMHRTRDLDNNWCIYYVENRGYGDYNIYQKYYD